MLICALRPSGFACGAPDLVNLLDEMPLDLLSNDLYAVVTLELILKLVAELAVVAGKLHIPFAAVRRAADFLYLAVKFKITDCLECRSLDCSLIHFSTALPLLVLLSSRTLEYVRRAINLCRETVERICDNHHFVVSLFPVALLYGFAHARQSLDAVASVKAWRVNLVLEPGATR